jgi:hypothetical protein
LSMLSHLDVRGSEGLYRAIEGIRCYSTRVEGHGKAKMMQKDELGKGNLGYKHISVPADVSRT